MLWTRYLSLMIVVYCVNVVSNRLLKILVFFIDLHIALKSLYSITCFPARQPFIKYIDCEVTSSEFGQIKLLLVFSCNLMNA